MDTKIETSGAQLYFSPEAVQAGKIASNQAFRKMIEMNYQFNGDMRFSVLETIGLLTLVAHVGGLSTESIQDAVESGRLDAVDALAEGKTFADFLAVREHIQKCRQGETVN